MCSMQYSVFLLLFLFGFLQPPTNSHVLNVTPCYIVTVFVVLPTLNQNIVLPVSVGVNDLLSRIILILPHGVIA